jgi:hypothetical protein
LTVIYLTGKNFVKNVEVIIQLMVWIVQNVQKAVKIVIFRKE